VSMLALERAYFEKLGAKGRGDGQLERHALDVRERSELSVQLRRGDEQAAGPLLLAEQVRVDQCGCLGAEEDLARLRRGLHLDRPRGGGPGDEKLPVRLADEEELERPGVD